MKSSRGQPRQVCTRVIATLNVYLGLTGEKLHNEKGSAGNAIEGKVADKEKVLNK